MINDSRRDCWRGLNCAMHLAEIIHCDEHIHHRARLCPISHPVGGVSDADLAHLHTLASVATDYRGQRPLPQTFWAKLYP
jgi:hypothetical protein